MAQVVEEEEETVAAVAARHLQFHQEGLLLRELALRVAQLGVAGRQLPAQLRDLRNPAERNILPIEFK